MHRILLIHSYQGAAGLPDSVYNEQIIKRNPHLAKFKLAHIGIVERTDDHYWDFGIQLELLCMGFKPDYIMVHTGAAFDEYPLLVIRSLIKVSKKLPNVKIGFQAGKDMALKFGLSGGRSGWKRVIEGIDITMLSSLENDPAFQETDDLKEIIKEVYFTQK
ncbi:MAG TPA: hypothetical protein VK141_04185 [Nitrosomonas sp.]|nr:hypothetical protein [Nitrosomonas sp.]